MTLIAFATERTSATVIADSLGYSPGGRRVAPENKLKIVDGIDVVLAGSGIRSFAEGWWRVADELAQDVDGFDKFTDRAATVLPGLWTDFCRARADEGIQGEPHPTTEFVIGYSARERRFKAYGYHSGFGFEPVELEAHVQPVPADGTGLGRFERDVLEGVLRKAGTDPAILDGWPTGPFRPPTSRNGWARLAKNVRLTRAVATSGSGLVTILGGDVVQARMTRDGITTSVIHTFDDDGDEFRKMMAASLHPTSQLASCWWCDSGRPFVDCCLADRLAGKPCPCGAAATFDACCSVHHRPQEATEPQERVPDGASVADEAARFLFEHDLGLEAGKLLVEAIDGAVRTVLESGRSPEHTEQTIRAVVALIRGYADGLDPA